MNHTPVKLKVVIEYEEQGSHIPYVSTKESNCQAFSLFICPRVQTDEVNAY